MDVKINNESEKKTHKLSFSGVFSFSALLILALQKYPEVTVNVPGWLNVASNVVLWIWSVFSVIMFVILIVYWIIILLYSHTDKLNGAKFSGNTFSGAEKGVSLRKILSKTWNVIGNVVIAVLSFYTGWYLIFAMTIGVFLTQILIQIEKRNIVRKIAKQMLMEV